MADAPKLLDRVRAEVRLRHYSRRTEEAYVHRSRRYIVFHGKRHPRDLVAGDVAAFLRWLAVGKQISASTQNQAFSGLLFLYERASSQRDSRVKSAAMLRSDRSNTCRWGDRLTPIGNGCEWI